MRIVPRHAALLLSLSLAALCSCATRSSRGPRLPPETSFNQEAGRGHYLRLKLQLEHGPEFDCLLDTGSPVTILPRRLEPKLGKRLDTEIMYFSQGLKTNGVYAAPRLYLGGVPLRTDSSVQTSDETGFLGMDVLRQYCIQLDFTANKLRFLDPDHLNTNDLGEAFPLEIVENHVIARADFLGAHKWVIDTGTPFDAVLNARQFERASRDQDVVPIAIGRTDNTTNSGACFPSAVFGGKNYSDVYVDGLPQNVTNIPNMIGLAFLARNLVTFNFPKRTLYLRQATAGSLNLGGILTLEANTFLKILAERAQLPGWRGGKDEIDWTCETEESESYPLSRTFKFQTGAWVDITPKIKSLASTGAVSIAVSNELSGRDPVPGIVKQLRVRFRRDNQEQMAEASEGETLAIPAGADITKARYGQLRGENVAAVGEESGRCVYHYAVVRKSKSSPWKLQRAWRTGADDHIVEEYPIPQ